MEKKIGVEIGYNKQQIAIGYSNGRIIEEKSTKEKHPNGAIDILKWIEITIKNLLDNEHSISKISVGFGGPVETKSGRILSSLQVSGWDNFNLKEWFEKKFSIKTEIYNDTVLGGYGELLIGAGVLSKNMLYTNIGSGIGGGVFLNRKYFDGYGCGAAYLGNTLVPDWTNSKNGSYDRLEKFCSSIGIENRLNQLDYVPKNSCLYQSNKKITCYDLIYSVNKKDLFACEELDRIAESFSIALANFLALYGVDTIVIGGGIANFGKPLFDRINHFTDKLVFIVNKNKYKIKKSKNMDNAVIIGALLV